MKYTVDKDRLYNLYMDWVRKVLEECDWKTSFAPQEIVHSIGRIIEDNPDLIKVENVKKNKKEK